jgi:hypothetical protein
MSSLLGILGLTSEASSIALNKSLTDIQNDISSLVSTSSTAAQTISNAINVTDVGEDLTIDSTGQYTDAQQDINTVSDTTVDSQIQNKVMEAIKQATKTEGGLSLPGTGTITSGHAPLLRPANTDLNLTLAMATVAVISSHVFGFISVGVFTHLNKFIQIGTLIKSIRKGPIAIFTALVEMIVGLIEIASEVSKIFSLSLRLFGNIFAGEVLISVIGSIAILMVPAPFMFLELLVGLIQAAVFSILTLVYMTVASSQPHGGDEEGAHH